MILDRLRDEHFVTTSLNGLRAFGWAKGVVAEVRGQRWRITRIKPPIGRWGSVRVYGVRVK